MRRTVLAFCLLLCACNTPTPPAPASPPRAAHAEPAPAPDFAAYPAGAPHTGLAATLSPRNALAREYRSRFGEALAGEPVFAGEYILVQWGCGTACVEQAFVSKRSGEVLDVRFGGGYGPWVQGMRLDSRLLSVEGPVMDAELKQTGYRTREYVLEAGKLVPLKDYASTPSTDNEHNLYYRNPPGG